MKKKFNCILSISTGAKTLIVKNIW